MPSGMALEVSLANTSLTKIVSINCIWQIENTHGDIGRGIVEFRPLPSWFCGPRSDHIEIRGVLN